MPELDLTLASLYRLGGKTLPAKPALAAQTPPRRAARGRERDRLIVYLALGGNTPLADAEYENLIAQLSDRFYRTAGSVTLALKTAAEAANAALVERNMRTTGHGQYAMALLALAALREHQLFLAQCGPVHAFWLKTGGDPRHYFEPQLAGRGLGFSQTPRLTFAHIELGSGDRLVLAAQMPAEWEQLLLAERGTASLEATRRRLLASNAPDLHAALIQAQAGSGKLTVVPAEVGQSPRSPTAAPPAADAQPAGGVPPVESPPVEAPPTVGRLAAFTAGDVPAMMPDLPPGVVPPAMPPGEGWEYPGPTGEQFPPPAEETTAPDAISPYGPASAASGRPRAGGATPGETVADRRVPVMARQPISPGPSGRRGGQGVFLALGTAVRASRLFLAGLGTRLSGFVPRLLPGMEANPAGGAASGASRTTLLFIAIAVPLVIGSVAAAVYFQRGRAAQFETFYQRAGDEAGLAVAAGDPGEQRQHWLAALQLLDQAESYAKSDESLALRAQAQNSLDALDRITRLNYQRAFAGRLGGTVTQMAATNSDVYLLERGTGAVQHAARSELGYSLDGGFQCGPGTYGSLSVGPLVDLVTLQANNARSADILAVDAAGNGLYCAPDSEPQAFQLASPPQPLQQVTAITSSGDTLYVLDAPGNYLWQYDGNQGEFDTTPLAFFGAEVPPLTTAIDMAVLDANMFLLHSDSHVTSCTLSLIPDLSPTRCTDPATLIDTRSGNLSGTALSGATFIQIQNTPPPNAYVALLDGAARAIYRFSPSQLELQDQLRAESGAASSLPPGVPASAFTIAPNHIVFLGVGDSVYFAEEPSP